MLNLQGQEKGGANMKTTHPTNPDFKCSRTPKAGGGEKCGKTRREEAAP